MCLRTETEPSVGTRGFEPQRFEAGQPLAVHYDAAQCFDTCNRQVEADLSSAPEGDGLIAVTTTLRWERALPQEGLLCGDNCGRFDWVFPIEPLPEDGNYTLQWAGQGVDFVVPSEDIVCIGTRAPGELREQ